MSQLLTEVDKVSELSGMESQAWATVVSIVPFEIHSRKPGLYPGYFHLIASKNGIPVLCHIPVCKHFVYIDEDRGSLGVDDAPDKVAKAIAFDYINAQIGTTIDAIPGITFLPGKLTLREVIAKHQGELDKIKTLQQNWFKRIVQMAKDDWTRYRQHAAISDIQRIVAVEMGMNPKENEWMEQAPENKAIKDCPACAEPIRAAAKICKFCRTDLVEWANRYDEVEPTKNEVKEKEETKQ